MEKSGVTAIVAVTILKYQIQSMYGEFMINSFTLLQSFHKYYEKKHRNAQCLMCITMKLSNTYM